MSEPLIGTIHQAPLLDRLARRVVNVIRIQADALAEIARALRSRQCRGRRAR